MTQLELEEQISRRDERLINSQSLVMIQCVGCRQEDRNYCSRICCSEAMKNALKLKAINRGDGHLRAVPGHEDLRVQGGLLPRGGEQGREVHPL